MPGNICRMPGNARESEKNARGKITQIITFVHDKNESLNFNESLNVSNYIIYGIARNGPFAECPAVRKECPGVYIIRISLKPRLRKYQSDLKLSLFLRRNKAKKFKNFKFCYVISYSRNVVVGETAPHMSKPVVLFMKTSEHAFLLHWLRGFSKIC